MSELTVTIIKLAFLCLLWLFIISAVSVMRADLFGTRVGRRNADDMALVQPTKKDKPPKTRRGEPTQVFVVEGSSTGMALRLGTETIVIGRGAECDLRIDDEYISTRHAVLRLHDGRWYAEDLGSTNGTFVDNARIHGPTEVHVDSTVRVGKTVLELRK